MKTVLKNKQFLLLILGRTTSNLGSNMQQFALSLYVYSITGSPKLFASLLAISIVPRLLLSPIAGIFGDWFDRKKSIVSIDLINGLVIGLYGVYYLLNGKLSILSIYILVIFLETTEVFFGSAMAAVVPSIVKKENLFEANKLSSISRSLSDVLSPIIASSLYALLGLQLILFINSISFIISALFELLIKIPAFHKKPSKINFKAFSSDFIAGVNIVREHKIFITIIGLGLFLNFALAPLFSVGLIYIMFDLFKATEIQYGTLTTIMAVSMLIGPLFFGKRIQKVPVGKLTLISFSIINALIFVFALITHPALLTTFNSNLIPIILTTIIVFLIGLSATLVNISISTLFGKLVPKEFMGRTGTVMAFFLTIATPLGQLFFGFLIDLTSALTTISIIGVIVFIAIIFFSKSLLEADAEQESFNKEKIQTAL